MIITLDTESTTKHKGHPFTESNKLCLVGMKSYGKNETWKIEYDDEPYGTALREIQDRITDDALIVGFNLKHDLHWLRRYGIRLGDVRVWDVQLAYFLLSGQTKPYPSLDMVSEEYGFGKKLDIVKTEYWEKGIDSTEVPLDLFTEYLCKDLDLTYQCYLHQLKLLRDKPKLHTCIRMACMDLLVLEEMEYNGIILDVDTCNKYSDLVIEEMREIDGRLNVLVGSTLVNWNSIYHISAVLYGGDIPYTDKELVERTLKDGSKSVRLRNVERKLTFNRQVEPLKGSNLAKVGYFSVSEDTLAELKPKAKAKEIIGLIQRRQELNKLNGTYYQGLPALIRDMEWADNTIHGNLNQCVAVTGRLSSTKPNMQNNPAIVDKLFRSRYE